MITIFLVILLLVMLMMVMTSARVFERGLYFPHLIIVGFLLRLALQFVTRNVPFFTHGAGGDANGYEMYAEIITVIWDRLGMHYVDGVEMPELGATTLPTNLFALIIHATTPATQQIACTAVVAFAAALTAINMFLLAVEFGAKPAQAALFISLFYFQPAFLFYTSDMYKDGLVLCLTLGAFGSALRLSRRFSVLQSVVGLVALWGLWYVRYYLIFVSIAPLLVGIVGVGKRASGFRSIIAAVVLIVGAVLLASFTDILQSVTERASSSLAQGTSQVVILDNSTHGSGVLFDDGGVPYRALPAKLLYTLFSPFLWSSGSLGFQLGKLDVLVWYFVVYRAARAVRQVDSRFLMMLATFVVPTTLAYAMSMSNIGLMVRQRLVIVAAVTILAAMYRPKEALAQAGAWTPARILAQKNRRLLPQSR